MMRCALASLFFLMCLGNGLVAQPVSADASYKIFFPQKQCNPVAFNQAWAGYHYLKSKNLLANAKYLSIVDFSKPSNTARLFVLDVLKMQTVFSSITAHGFGSDPDSLVVPYRFSNDNDSRQSSVGFYLTGSTYYNHRPDDSLGLCLFGLDIGFNNNAALREIVIHYGATERSGKVYVTDSGAARSYGCPALPLSSNTPIINLINGGSCLYIYSDVVKNYAALSTVLNKRLSLPQKQVGPPPNNCTCTLTKTGHAYFSSSPREK